MVLTTGLANAPKSVASTSASRSKGALRVRADEIPHLFLHRMSVLTIAFMPSAAPAPVARPTRAARNAVVVRAEQKSDGMQTDRRSVLGAGLALTAATTVNLSSASPALANKVLSSDWEQVDLPISNEVVLLDIGFTGKDNNHGTPFAAFPFFTPSYYLWHR